MGRTPVQKIAQRARSPKPERDDGGFIDEAWELLTERLALCELHGSQPRWPEVHDLLRALAEAFDPAFDPMKGVPHNRAARLVQRDADANSANHQRTLAAALLRLDPDLARQYASLVRGTDVPPGFDAVSAFRPFIDALDQPHTTVPHKASTRAPGNRVARRVVKRRRTPDHRHQDEMLKQWKAYQECQPGRAFLKDWIEQRPACLAGWTLPEIAAALAAARKRASRHPARTSNPSKSTTAPARA